MTKNLYYTLIVALFAIAAFLRLGYLNEIPGSYNQDELSNYYDAWSIIETGSDRFDSPLPWTLRAFGESDNRPALFTYLSIPLVYIFQSPIGVRLTSAIFGLLAMVLLWRICRTFQFSPFNTLLALLLFALTPWYIAYSRIGFESATLYPLLSLSIFYLSLKVFYERKTDYKHLLGLSFLIILSTYAYQAGKLSGLLFFIAAIFGMFRIQLSIKKIIFFTIPVLIGGLPYLYEMIYQPDLFFGRANSTMLSFSPVTYGITFFIDNLTSHFAPHFLFFELLDAFDLTPFRLLIVAFPFFYFGLVLISKRKTINWICYIYLLICIIPASLTTNNPHALRAASASLIYPLFIVIGWQFLVEKLPAKHQLKAKLGYVILILSCFYFQFRLYLTDPRLREPVFQFDTSEIYNKVQSQYSESNLIIEHHGNQPYIYYLVNSSINPNEFKQMEVKYHTSHYGFDLFDQIGPVQWLYAKELNETYLDSLPNNTIFIHHSDSINHICRPIDHVIYNGIDYQFCKPSL